MLVEAYIKKLYDNEIRNSCNSLKQKLEYCFENNEKNAIKNCDREITNFRNCIIQFDKDFREKYNRVTKNLKTIY